MNKCECGCGALAKNRFVVGHNMFGPDLKGKVYGRVTVLSRLPRSSRREKWICQCECGKLFERRGSVLLTGKSTGCRSCNNGWKKKPFEATFNMMVGSCKKRGIPVTITYADYLEFTKIKKCHYCKVPIFWKPNGDQKTGYKLDRMDNSKGYSVDNCVVCCPRCNWAKQDHFTYDEWKSIGRLIQTWEK